LGIRRKKDIYQYPYIPAHEAEMLLNKIDNEVFIVVHDVSDVFVDNFA